MKFLIRLFGVSWILVGALLVQFMPQVSAQDSPWLQRPWKEDMMIPAGWYQGPGSDVWTEEKRGISWEEGSLVENATFYQKSSASMEMTGSHFRKTHFGLCLWGRMEAADCLFENATFGDRKSVV